MLTCPIFPYTVLGRPLHPTHKHALTPTHAYRYGSSYMYVWLSIADTGKPRESTSRTTVFKRALDKSYHLKLKASR